MFQPEFLVWPEFHPVLLGAGCLALGYVYGWHCRAASEIPPREPAATDQDVCCAQSQSNTYLEDLERCKCCMSAPAEMDTGLKGRGSKFSTRSPYLDAAEGFEQAERSAKRDLEHRNSMDLCGHHRDETEGEAHGMRQHSSSPCFEKSYQMLKEERGVLQAKSPYKKQKGTPVEKEPIFCAKGKAEMSREGDEDDDAAAESVPWSQEVLNKRIDYFNNATSEASNTGRSDESRKLRHFKKSFLKASAAEGEPTYNSISMTSSHISGGAERPTSCGGLIPLATPDHHVDCSQDNSPNSLHRISGVGLFPQLVPAAPETLNIVDRLHSGNGVEGGSKDAVRDAGAVTVGEALSNELESTAVAAASEMLQTEPSSAQAPALDHVPDRSSGRMELKKEVPEDKVLKAEIYGLLNEANCSEVSFQGIVSLLEERLHTDL